jgi:cephalosporin-C deacetylase-like acetyl esterase
MLDRPRVIALATMMGYDETAMWLRTHREAYAVGVFQGFQVIEEGETPCADSAEQWLAIM